MRQVLTLRMFTLSAMCKKHFWQIALKILLAFYTVTCSENSTKGVKQDSTRLIPLYLHSFVCTTGNHFAGILRKPAAVYSPLVNFHSYQKCVLWFLSLITKNQTIAQSLSLKSVGTFVLLEHINGNFSPPIKIQLPFSCQLAGFLLCLLVDFWVSGFTQTHLD